MALLRCSSLGASGVLLCPWAGDAVGVAALGPFLMRTQSARSTHTRMVLAKGCFNSISCVGPSWWSKGCSPLRRHSQARRSRNRECRACDVAAMSALLCFPFAASSLMLSRRGRDARTTLLLSSAQEDDASSWTQGMASWGVLARGFHSSFLSSLEWRLKRRL